MVDANIFKMVEDQWIQINELRGIESLIDEKTKDIPVPEVPYEYFDVADYSGNLYAKTKCGGYSFNSSDLTNYGTNDLIQVYPNRSWISFISPIREMVSISKYNLSDCGFLSSYRNKYVAFKVDDLITKAKRTIVEGDSTFYICEIEILGGIIEVSFIYLSANYYVGRFPLTYSPSIPPATPKRDNNINGIYSNSNTSVGYYTNAMFFKEPNWNRVLFGFVIWE